MNRSRKSKKPLISSILMAQAGESGESGKLRRTARCFSEAVLFDADESMNPQIY